MFEKIKVRWATSQALVESERFGYFDNSKRAVMDGIANNIINASFGADLLKSGAAVNRHAAAAAIFARLAEASRQHQTTEIEALDWVNAGVSAMVSAGAPRSAARVIVRELMKIHARSVEESTRHFDQP